MAPKPIKPQDDMDVAAGATEKIREVCIALARERGISYISALHEFRIMALESDRQHLLPFIRSAINYQTNMSTLDRDLGFVDLRAVPQGPEL